ncbi:MAG: hypothetical protein JNK02_02245 [Planctomycetes bacterium]|nr:hypothetical protein [Planctomycetota bacterium]
MGKDEFKIRFDRHGHIVIDDPELERRILFLLEHDRQLVLRLNAEGVEPPKTIVTNLRGCPLPEPTPIHNPKGCPNTMCDFCGPDLKVVDNRAFTKGWDRLKMDHRQSLDQ